MIGTGVPNGTYIRLVNRYGTVPTGKVNQWYRTIILFENIQKLLNAFFGVTRIPVASSGYKKKLRTQKFNAHM